MTEADVSAALYTFLTDHTVQEEFYEEHAHQITEAQSFEEAGVMTHNEGIVLTVMGSDGERQEFQVTVVESTR